MLHVGRLPFLYDRMDSKRPRFQNGNVSSFGSGMVKVKICGITNLTDARRAVEAGADFLGFNFYPQSPRYISPAKARGIVRRLPSQVTVVGVFVNAPEDKMLSIARSVGLDYLQLHGEESPELVARLKRSYPVIKAVRVR